VSAVEVIGWAGTVSGTILGLPQVLRLLQTGRVDGLSLTAWQAMLVINPSWTAHGISIGQVPQIVTSALSLCSTLPILYLMARELQRHLLPVLLPGLLATGALIAVDQILGSAAFGAAAIIAAVVSNAEYRADPLKAHRRCRGTVPDPRRGQPRTLAVLGDLGTRDRHHDLRHHHRNHHSVQPDLVVATHAGTAAPLCCRHSRSATSSHGSTATARRVTGPGRCRGSASPGVRLIALPPAQAKSGRVVPRPRRPLHRERAEV
jgi:uncharacterized protein with PQ loop repeat